MLDKCEVNRVSILNFLRMIWVWAMKWNPIPFSKSRDLWLNGSSGLAIMRLEVSNKRLMGI
jgi:hypothetical protein